jgi:hypothetical protein
MLTLDRWREQMAKQLDNYLVLMFPKFAGSTVDQIKVIDSFMCSGGIRYARELMVKNRRDYASKHGTGNIDVVKANPKDRWHIQQI